MKELEYAKDIQNKLTKIWDKGTILQQILHTNIDKAILEFPYKEKIKQPAAKERSENFNLVKKWCDHWKEQADSLSKSKLNIRIEYSPINDRILGRQELPTYVAIGDINSFISYIKKEKETNRFLSISTLISSECPELFGLMYEKPFDFLEHDQDEWNKIIQVTKWIISNPNSDIYLRQLEIPLIDTKFIEKHDKILKRTINHLLNKSENDFETTKFENRYGFKSKPVTIHFRILDKELSINGLTDLEIPIEDFINLNLPIKRAFIVENKITGLAFPYVKDSIVIFGLGYGLDRLRKCKWLENLQLFYWGDLDTNGFAMLDQFRSYFPKAQSMLMTSDIILEHKPMWVEETKQAIRELPRLTPEEKETYQELINQKYTKNLRLEQERISFSFLKKYLENTFSHFEII